MIGENLNTDYDERKNGQNNSVFDINTTIDNLKENMEKSQHTMKYRKQQRIEANKCKHLQREEDKPNRTSQDDDNDKSYNDNSNNGNNNGNDNNTNHQVISVKFQCENGDYFTKSHNLTTMIRDIKSELSRLYAVSGETIKLFKDDVELTDSKRLIDLELKPFSAVSLKVITPSLPTIDKTLVYDHIPIVDVITVQVTGNDGANKAIVVEIEKESFAGDAELKSFGKSDSDKRHFRDVATQTTVSHSMPKKMADKTTNTPVHRCIQTSLKIYIPSCTDKILAARTANDTGRLKERSAIKIQRAFKRWMEKKSIRDQRVDTESFAIRREIDKINGSRIALERWYDGEKNRIQVSEADEKERTEQLLNLLKRRNVLRLMIDTKTSAVRKRENKIKLIRLMNDASKPVSFRNKCGELIEIDTVQCQQLRKLGDLYERFSDDTRRHDVVDDLLEYFDSKKDYLFSDDVIRLLCMLNHFVSKRVSADAISSLVIRIEELILYYAYREVIFTQQRSELVGKSKTYDNRTISLVDDAGELTVYQSMLINLRGDEAKIFKCYASIACFKLSVQDVYQLVHEIWQDRPIDDEAAEIDKNDLRLTRWNKRKEWNPWNCIVLPKGKVKYHLEAANVESLYGEYYTSQVRTKHLKARIHFLGLLKTQ